MCFTAFTVDNEQSTASFRRSSDTKYTSFMSFSADSGVPPSKRCLVVILVGRTPASAPHAGAFGSS